MSASITSRPRTLSELAAYYGVDRKTFRRWLDCPTLKDVRPETGIYFSINQVKAIVAHIGNNENI